MIMVLKTSHHGPSDAKHNPFQLLRLLSKEVCFIYHRVQHASIGFLISRLLILKRGSNTSSWKSCQGDSSKLNLPDHSFQDNEHEGKDTRSQGGIRFKDKDLKISRVKSQDKVKAKDQDIKIKLRDIKSKIKIQDHKHAKGTSKEFPRTQGSKIQDVTRCEAINVMTNP
ncbi:hypothetical protein Tco_1220385 [Tanacetum coccineum]